MGPDSSSRHPLGPELSAGRAGADAAGAPSRCISTIAATAAPMAAETMKAPRQPNRLSISSSDAGATAVPAKPAKEWME